VLSLTKSGLTYLLKRGYASISQKRYDIRPKLLLMSKLYMRWHQGRWPWMTLNGYKFEFSAKFALWNFKHIRQVATLPHVTLTSARLSCHLCRAVTYLPVNWTRQNYCTVIQYKSNDDDDHYNDDDETVSTLCRRWECVRIQVGSSISGSTHSKYGWVY